MNIMDSMYSAETLIGRDLGNDDLLLLIRDQIANRRGAINRLLIELDAFVALAEKRIAETEKEKTDAH